MLLYCALHSLWTVLTWRVTHPSLAIQLQLTMDARVAQLAYSTRHLTYPHYAVSLQLQYKECYIIHSGHHAVDYTGMRIWPGAHLLAYFLLHSQHSQHSLQGQVVCELGAGVGLCGLLAARYCHHVLLTDRVQAVLEVIDRNITLNQLALSASPHVLEWGCSGARTLLPTLRHLPPVSLVLAADVIYPDTTEESMHALFDTVTTLLSSASSSTATSSSSPLHGRFVLSYVNRSASTCRRFLNIAHSHHYVATHIPPSTYLVTSQQQQQMSVELQHLHGYILVFEKVDDEQLMTATAQWLEAEPFASLVVRERDEVAEDGRQQQQAMTLADEDETNALPMSAYDEEVAPLGQKDQVVAV